MKNQTLITNIKKLYTSHQSPPVKGEKMSEIFSLENAYLIFEDGIIKDIGVDFDQDMSTFDKVYDATGLICVPGFIDSHTHLVFGGSREDEFSLKLEGVPYLDILKNGGGILNTVQKTRDASFEDLYKQAKKSLDEMLLYGVTTIEAKSGYGLELETELKQLKVLKALNDSHPIDIHATYLGAHALPKTFANQRQDFIEIIKKDLEVVHAEGLAEYVDVFCETGVFTAKETEEILEKAKSLGFKLRVHTDEIDSIGGTEVSLKLGAKTVDHLMALKEEDMEELAKSDTIGNLLPATSFFLNKEYAPARKMIEKGMALSISSDYNPGSTPSENYQLALQLAANKLRMKPNEILTASTINPAYSLDIHHQYGALKPGYVADILLLDAKNWDYVMYHYGINHTAHVFKKGVLVVKDRHLIKESI